MRDQLPPELSRRWGHLQYVKRQSGEWSAECPECGDSGHQGRDWPDRFRMWDNPARGWCRRCGFQSFADSDKPSAEITPEMRQQWLQQRIEREEEKQIAIAQTLSLLRKEEKWLWWHEQMQALGRDWWHGKGVPDAFIDYYRLGWCNDRQFYYDQNYFSTATATIPVWGTEWELVNVRHRLLNTPNGCGKYRADRTGLPSNLFLTKPDEKPHGEVVLVEGEIKSIVCFSRLCDDGYNVIGTPGKSFSLGLLDDLGECDRVWIVFDPDAKRQAWKTARAVGEAARVVYLPVKADDAFTMYGATAQTFEAALRYGRQV